MEMLLMVLLLLLLLLLLMMILKVGLVVRSVGGFARLLRLLLGGQGGWLRGGVFVRVRLAWVLI